MPGIFDKTGRPGSGRAGRMIRAVILLAILVLILGAIIVIWYSGRPGTDFRIIKSSAPNASPPEATIAQGTVTGVWTRDTRIATFGGIPYAAPPVGPLRWRAPQAPGRENGTLDGTRFGAQCLQNRSFPRHFVRLLIDGHGWNPLMQWLIRRRAESVFSSHPAESEDCLFVNIKTGNLRGDTLHPVMVWIHGGGHQSGHGSDAIYLSDNLVERDVILVTFNYRLGLFGYLAHPALSAEDEQGVSGNYGLQDQIAALQWVKRNIAAFGGDPDRVTIFGESAGGHAVSALMASPMADGLYHRAILQSGVFSFHHQFMARDNLYSESAEKKGQNFLDRFLPPDGRINDRAAALRTLPAERLMQAQAEFPRSLDQWLPATDGWVLPKTVGQAMQDGDLNPVPIMLGFNADEGSILYDIAGPKNLYGSHHPPESVEQVLHAVRSNFGPEAESLIRAYNLSDREQYRAGEIAMLGDFHFGVHTRALARSHARHHDRIFAYFFTRTPPQSGQTIGAYHFAEVPFALDNHDQFIPVGADDRLLAKTMADYWTNFAKFGDPNAPGLPPWSAYDPERDNWQKLDHQIEQIQGLRTPKLDALEAYERRMIEATRSN